MLRSSPAKATSIVSSGLIAERILKSAANGERDRVRLRNAALFDLQAAARLLVVMDDRVG
jgi:hypothetical protein